MLGTWAGARTPRILPKSDPKGPDGSCPPPCQCDDSVNESQQAIADKTTIDCREILAQFSIRFLDGGVLEWQQRRSLLLAFEPVGPPLSGRDE